MVYFDENAFLNIILTETIWYCNVSISKNMNLRLKSLDKQIKIYG